MIKITYIAPTQQLAVIAERHPNSQNEQFKNNN